MSEYKVPIYYDINDKLQLYTYANLSVIDDIVYVVICNVLYKAYLYDCKVKDIDQLLKTSHYSYFKENINKTRIVYSNNVYFLEHLIDNNVNSVIDVELIPICSIENSDIKFLINKLEIKI